MKKGEHQTVPGKLTGWVRDKPCDGWLEKEIKEILIGSATRGRGGVVCIRRGRMALSESHWVINYRHSHTLCQIAHHTSRRAAAYVLPAALLRPQLDRWHSLGAEVENVYSGVRRDRRLIIFSPCLDSFIFSSSILLSVLVVERLINVCFWV